MLFSKKHAVLEKKLAALRKELFEERQMHEHSISVSLGALNKAHAAAEQQRYAEEEDAAAVDLSDSLFFATRVLTDRWHILRGYIAQNHKEDENAAKIAKLRGEIKKLEGEK